MRIEHLQEFVYLADTLSFNVTAKKFYISVSALSRHIASMEEEVGGELFFRDGRKVALTDLGAAFRKDAREIVELYTRSIERMKVLNEGGRMLIQIGYLVDMGKGTFQRIHSIFKKIAPNVQLRFHAMEYQQLSEALVDRKIDVAITLDMDHALLQEYDKVKVWQTHYGVLVESSHPIAAHEDVSPSELDGVSMVLPDPIVLPSFYQAAYRVMQAADVSPNVVGYYGDIHTLYSLLDLNKAAALSLSHHMGFGDGFVFMPLRDSVDVSCNICAAWSKGAPRDMADIARVVFEGLGKQKAPFA